MRTLLNTLENESRENIINSDIEEMRRVIAPIIRETISFDEVMRSKKLSFGKET